MSDNSVSPIRLLPQLERSRERRRVTCAASENVTVTRQRWLPWWWRCSKWTSAELSCVTLTEVKAASWPPSLRTSSFQRFRHTEVHKHSALLASRPVNKPGRDLSNESLLTVVNSGARQAVGGGVSSLTRTARALGFRGSPIEKPHRARRMNRERLTHAVLNRGISKTAPCVRARVCEPSRRQLQAQNKLGLLTKIDSRHKNKCNQPDAVHAFL